MTAGANEGQARGLAATAVAFATELDQLIDAVLPGEHPTVSAVQVSNRIAIRPGAGEDIEPVSLRSDGSDVAELLFHYTWALDSERRFPAVAASQLTVRPPGARRPLLRYEFNRDHHTDPAAHWQIHPEQGGPLSAFMAATGSPAAEDLSNLHIPVGGSRFRPCLEDLLQLLIVDCKIDSVPGWQTAVDAGRTRWRRTQIMAAVRDAPEAAARVLTECGYTVTPPAGAHRPDRVDRLKAW